jgi:hypothetical protein
MFTQIRVMLRELLDSAYGISRNVRSCRWSALPSWDGSMPAGLPLRHTSGARRLELDHDSSRDAVLVCPRKSVLVSRAPGRSVAEICATDVQHVRYFVGGKFNCAGVETLPLAGYRHSLLPCPNMCGVSQYGYGRFFLRFGANCRLCLLSLLKYRSHP